MQGQDKCAFVDSRNALRLCDQWVHQVTLLVKTSAASENFHLRDPTNSSVQMWCHMCTSGLSRQQRSWLPGSGDESGDIIEMENECGDNTWRPTRSLYPVSYYYPQCSEARSDIVFREVREACTDWQDWIFQQNFPRERHAISTAGISGKQCAITQPMWGGRNKGCLNISNLQKLCQRKEGWRPMAGLFLLFSPKG